MKERPILFKGDMVRAILDGRKTQTRRVAIPRHDDRKPCEHWSGAQRGDISIMSRYCDHGSEGRGCPYGVPGDTLWVRETWAHYQTVNYRRRPDGAAFNEVSDGLAGYRADGGDWGIEDFRDGVAAACEIKSENVLINGDRWRPSIHMPRWASRITLKVKDVRVERIMDIDTPDIIAEGLSTRHRGHDACVDLTHQWIDLWDSINEKRGFPCRKNPWVWVVEFEKTD